MRYVALALVLVLVGCKGSTEITADPVNASTPTATPTPSTSSPGAGENVSGSRLKVRSLVTSDGASVFAGLYDSELGVNCAMTKMDDGKTRCIPQTNSGVTIFFGDAQCTTPLVKSSTCLGSSAIAASTTTNACGAYAAKVYRVGASYAGSLYVKSGESCTVFTLTQNDGTYFTAGEEIPVTRLVEASETTAP